jgi:predicted amidohydrolase YtcJ
MTLYHNARFYTMRSREDIAKAILVDDNGIIQQVFDDDKAVFGGKKINLEGAYVYPGFTDTHTHSFEGGLYSNGADMGKASKISDVLELLALSEPVGGFVFGFNFDQNLIKEKRFPTRQELDKAVSDKPCLLRRIDGHSAAVNSLAEKKSGITNKQNEESGIYKAEKNDQICHWFHKNIGEEGILKAFAKAAELGVSKGHTNIHTMVGDASLDPLYYEIIDRHKGEYPVDFVLYPQIFDVKRALDLGAERIGGCILVDGSFGSGTAAVNEPYHNNRENSGILYKRDEEWYQFVKEAHDNGLSVAVHAIGDRAITQIVNIYSRVQQENPKQIRHQVIHNELITNDEVIGKMAKYDIAAVMQPEFDRLWGGSQGYYAEVLGKKRAENCNRLQSLVSAGVLVAGSSDWYITDLNALMGISSAVNLHNFRERLDPYQAMELYTSKAALLINREKREGKLVSGMVADFVCLDSDVMTSSDIAQISVIKVFKKGREVFSHPRIGAKRV